MILQCHLLQIFDGLAPWITHLAYLEGGHMLKGAYCIIVVRIWSACCMQV